MKLLSIAQKACRFLPVCLFICLLPAVSFGQQNRDSYPEQLLETAQTRHLDRERLWRVLLHYSEDSGGESKIDDPAFFLANNGKYSPEAELEATIQGMFAPAELHDKHPICRFPARYDWLWEQVGIDETRLPHPDCLEQRNYLNKTNPRSASLMFPSAYMNNPASMFGHTFIRIDSEYESELLSYAVNYAAQTNENNGIVYAWKGVFGLYKGFFSILPQHTKIREYSNLEHRDIWEYRLNLTKEEVHRMALHVWELRDVYSDYYFFDENCAYNLLFLLEAARPAVYLTNKTAPWVVPLDTISLIRSAGLISSTGYRPSQRLKIQAITRVMDSEEITHSQHMAYLQEKPDNDNANIPNERAIPVLDLAVELLQHSYGKQQISQEDYRKQLLPLLRERSRLGSAQHNPYSVKQPAQPEKGHASARISLGSGFDRGNAFTEFGIRPAYHALTDPGAGYVAGAQIQFLDTAIRYYANREQARLERLAFVDIVSLSEYERIFKRTSWKVTAGIDQVQKKNGEDVMAFRANTGGGLAYDTGLFGLAYGMVDLEGLIGQGLRDWYALGTGFSAGIIKTVDDKANIHINGKSIWYPLGEKRVSIMGEIATSFTISRNNSLNILYRYTDNSQQGKAEYLLCWNHFL